MKLSFSGTLEVEAEAFTRGASQSFEVKFCIKPFTTQIFLAFSSQNHPSLIISCSTIPDLQFSLDYGERALSRISNLVVLVLKSILNAHSAYPHFVPIIFKSDPHVEEPLTLIPVGLFNDSLLH